MSTDPRNHFQYVEGASVAPGGFSKWPETLGLAAIGDPALVRRFAEIARQEYRAVGIEHGAVAPGRPGHRAPLASHLRHVRRRPRARARPRAGLHRGLPARLVWPGAPGGRRSREALGGLRRRGRWLRRPQLLRPFLPARRRAEPPRAGVRGGLCSQRRRSDADLHDPAGRHHRRSCRRTCRRRVQPPAAHRPVCGAGMASMV